MRFAVVFASILFLVGCRQTVPLDGQLALGPSIQVANLEVWPVLSDAAEDVGRILTLAQAQEQEAVVIRELENAQVGKLVIENKGDTRILACAGTVVTGGKQDRQLGEDIVVDPQTTVAVKAFCVEPGRWLGTSNFRGTSQKTSAPVRTAGQYGDDQAQVWHDVEIAQAAGIGSGGSYASVKETSRRRQATAEQVERHLRAQGDNVVGYAYAIDGCAAGIRTFAHPALLEPRLQGFVRAMCVEAELQAAGVAACRVDFVPPQITQVGVCDQEIRLVPSAEARAQEVLARDPDDEHAKELARIARESRYVASEAGLRERFNAEWRALMAEIQSTALPHPNATRPPTTRARQEMDIPTLFRRLNAKPEEVSRTEGVNRNGYRRGEKGNHSACYVRTKDGRWVPLTRDWTAK